MNKFKFLFANLHTYSFILQTCLSELDYLLFFSFSSFSDISKEMWTCQMFLGGIILFTGRFNVFFTHFISVSNVYINVMTKFLCKPFPRDSSVWPCCHWLWQIASVQISSSIQIKTRASVGFLLSLWGNRYGDATWVSLKCKPTFCRQSFSPNPFDGKWDRFPKPKHGKI